MSNRTDRKQETNDHAGAKASGACMVSPIHWLSIRRVFRKAAGIGLCIGWDKYPCIIIIAIGMWTLILGPHIYSNEKAG